MKRNKKNKVKYNKNSNLDAMVENKKGRQGEKIHKSFLELSEALKSILSMKSLTNKDQTIIL